MPYSHANLVGWWDATTIGGLNDGDAVASWTDLMGNGNMAQSSSGDRPVYKTSIRNGYPIVRFDTTDWLDATARTCTTMTLALARAISTTSGSFFVQMWNGALAAGSSTGGGPLIFNTGLRSIYIRGVATPTDGTPTTAWERWIITFAAGATKLFVDGTEVITSGSSMGAVVSSGIARLGGSDNGPGSSPEYKSGGMDLGEAMIFNSALNSTDVAALDTYLATKWGTPMKTPIQRRPLRGLIIR